MEILVYGSVFLTSMGILYVHLRTIPRAESVSKGTFG